MRIVLSFDTSGSLLNRKAIPTPQSSDWPAGALVSWRCLVSFLLILFCLFVSSGHCLVPSGICHSIQAHPPPDSPAATLDMSIMCFFLLKGYFLQSLPDPPGGMPSSSLPKLCVRDIHVALTSGPRHPPPPPDQASLR